MSTTSPYFRVVSSLIAWRGGIDEKMELAVACVSWRVQLLRLTIWLEPPAVRLVIRCRGGRPQLTS